MPGAGCLAPFRPPPFAPHRPRGHHPSRPSLAPSRFFALQPPPPPTPRPPYTPPTSQNFRSYHRRSSTHIEGGCESLQGCSPLQTRRCSTFRNVGRQGARNFGKLLRKIFESRVFASVYGQVHPCPSLARDEKYITGRGDRGMRNITLIIERFQLCELCGGRGGGSEIGDRDASRFIRLFR